MFSERGVAMMINFHGAAEFSKDSEEFAVRRCEFALDRFSKTIDAVQISLRDENGPRGGEDIHCVVRVSLIGLPDVIVHEQSLSAETAISAAVDRAAFQVGRRIHRRVDKHRHVAVDNQGPFNPVSV